MKNAHLYFSNLNEGITQIERINLDGQERQLLVQLKGPNWISSMFVDGKQLFWADREMSTLMSYNLSDSRKSENVRVVAEHLDSPNGVTKMGLFSIFI